MGSLRSPFVERRGVGEPLGSPKINIKRTYLYLFKTKMGFTTTFFEYPFVRYLPYFLYTRVPDVEKVPSILISPFT